MERAGDDGVGLIGRLLGDNKRGLGWLPDREDRRDYTLSHPNVSPLPPVRVESKFDLRGWDTPVMDQGGLGSCTANAACGLLQFLANYNSGKYTPLSRLYVYKATRYIMGVQRGDTGASLRDTMMSLVLLGAPPETYWNYNITRYDDDPPWYVVAMADNYEGTRYIRLDPNGASPDKVLDNIRLCICSRLPVIFGTLVWPQIFTVGEGGDIPAPDPAAQPVGGHALMIVGYDDNRGCIGTERRGAFLIRNSWGASWGDHGYGWLPYSYLYDGYAQDFWTLQSARWVNTGDFA